MTAILIACLSLSAPVLERHARDFDNTVWEYEYGPTHRRMEIELNIDGTFVADLFRLEREGRDGGCVGNGTWTFKNNTLKLHYFQSHNRVDRYHFPGTGRGSARVLYEIGEQKYHIYLRKVK